MFGCDGAFQIPEETRPPGWVELGLEFSLADDPIYPKDRDVTAAIERLDPTFVPLMVRWVFLAPAAEQTGERERHVFRFHGIGRTTFTLNTEGVAPAEVDDGYDLLRINNLEVPPGYTGRVPQYLDPTVGILDDPKYLGMEKRFQSAVEQHNAMDLPGEFIPWDWLLVAAMKRCYSSEHTATELKDTLIHTPQARIKRKRDAKRLDFALDFKSFQDWANKKIQSASIDEHKMQVLKTIENRRLQELVRQQTQMTFKIHGGN